MTVAYQLSLFADNLPRYIACSDDLGAMVHLPRDQALAMPYIDPNPRNLIWAMVFDIDRRDAGAAWLDADLPMPSWIAQNPRNGHAHLGYTLDAPVSRSPKSRASPQRYLARIQHAMTARLDADRAYTHHLTKTPEHERWRTLWGRGAPYALDELREYLADDLPLRLRRDEAVGEGRNVTLFDGLRFWAYRARLNYDAWPAWLDACHARACALNAFACPLRASEVKATAKSVAKWTWTNISAGGFSAIQHQRGKRSGAVRASAALDARAPLIEFLL